MPVVSVPVVTFVVSVFVQARAKIASAATMMTARDFFMLFILLIQTETPCHQQGGFVGR